MRQKFIECRWRYQAAKACPWASIICKVCDGFQCFESYTDYKTWKNQK